MFMRHLQQFDSQDNQRNFYPPSVTGMKIQSLQRDSKETFQMTVNRWGRSFAATGFRKEEKDFH